MAQYSLVPTRGPSSNFGGGYGDLFATMLAGYLQGMELLKKQRQDRIQQMLDQYKVPAAAAGYDAQLAEALRRAYNARAGTTQDAARYGVTVTRPNMRAGMTAVRPGANGASPILGWFGLPGADQGQADVDILGGMYGGDLAPEPDPDAAEAQY